MIFTVEIEIATDSDPEQIMWNVLDQCTDQLGAERTITQSDADQIESMICQAFGRNQETTTKTGETS